jgi:hypothetical protein
MAKKHEAHESLQSTIFYLTRALEPSTMLSGLGRHEHDVGLGWDAISAHSAGPARHKNCSHDAAHVPAAPSFPPATTSASGRILFPIGHHLHCRLTPPGPRRSPPPPSSTLLHCQIEVGQHRVPCRCVRRRRHGSRGGHNFSWSTATTAATARCRRHRQHPHTRSPPSWPVTFATADHRLRPPVTSVAAAGHRAMGWHNAYGPLCLLPCLEPAQPEKTAMG